MQTSLFIFFTMFYKIQLLFLLEVIMKTNEEQGLLRNVPVGFVLQPW